MTNNGCFLHCRWPLCCLACVINSFNAWLHTQQRRLSVNHVSQKAAFRSSSRIPYCLCYLGKVTLQRDKQGLNHCKLLQSRRIALCDSHEAWTKPVLWQYSAHQPGPSHREPVVVPRAESALLMDV